MSCVCADHYKYQIMILLCPDCESHHHKREAVSLITNVNDLTAAHLTGFYFYDLHGKAVRTYCLGYRFQVHSFQVKVKLSVNHHDFWSKRYLIKLKILLYHPKHVALQPGRGRVSYQCLVIHSPSSKIYVVLECGT